MLDKILPAITGLIGALVGVSAFVFVGWTEGQKQYQIKKAETYAEFASSSWGGPDAGDDIAYVRAASRLTIYADDSVLTAFGAYTKSKAYAFASGEINML
jgi:hypothetical protein